MLKKSPKIYRKRGNGAITRVSTNEPGAQKFAPPSQKLEPARIQKILAQVGLGSRRMIEDWIKQGKIYVNGVVATLGQTISERDEVKVNDKVVSLQEHSQQPTRVLLYHKPDGEICSRHTEEGKPSVFSNLPYIKGAKWVMVGRLDVNSSGLLLFTNNGDLAHRLMHPRFQVERQYAVRVIGEMTENRLNKLKTGVYFDEGLFKFDEIIAHPKEHGVNQWFTVTMRQGRYREVRRLFESQGGTVNRLIRTRYGELSLPRDLWKGQTRELPESEVQRLLDFSNGAIKATSAVLA